MFPMHGSSNPSRMAMIKTRICPERWKESYMHHKTTSDHAKLDQQNNMVSWNRCLVDGYALVHKGRFCISDRQTWDSLPLSSSFGSTIDVDNVQDNEVLLLPTCCGSLCKYLMVASGKVSVFIQHARAERVNKDWDHAVGVICVQDAGGKVTDWNGDQLDLAADQKERKALFPPGGIVVSNSILHQQILEIIASSSSVIS